MIVVVFDESFCTSIFRRAFGWQGDGERCQQELSHIFACLKLKSWRVSLLLQSRSVNQRFAAPPKPRSGNSAALIALVVPQEAEFLLFCMVVALFQLSSSEDIGVWVVVNPSCSGMSFHRSESDFWGVVFVLSSCSRGHRIAVWLS